MSEKPPTPQTRRQTAGDFNQRSERFAPTHINLEDPIDEDEWYQVFELINYHVRQFKKLLRFSGSTTTAKYLNEWTILFNDVTDHKNEFVETTWQNIAMTYISILIDDFPQFVQTLLDKVPPINVALYLHEVNGEHYLSVYDNWQSFGCDDAQKKSHEEQIQREQNCKRDERDNDDDSSFHLSKSEVSPLSGNITFQQQVKDMEAKLDMETKAIRTEIKSTSSEIKDLKADLLKSIKEGIAAAVGDPQKYDEDLKKSIKDGERISAKLQGDLKKGEEKLSDLRSKADNLKKIAEDATAHATKAYTSTKLDFETKNATLLKSMTTAINDLAKNVASGPPVPAPSATSTAHHTVSAKYYADEYRIGSDLYRVQAKKFIEDSTPIVCHNGDEMLQTYDLLKEIAANYGILLADKSSLSKWDKTMYDNPPTCPYNDSMFTSDRQHRECYSKMKIALATKLKSHVQFGPNYLAADIAITNYSHDGYRMLYDLMANAHPQLKRDSAQQPRKPVFQGDMSELIFKFQNYYAYKESRSHPHYYEEYEKTEAVIYAIKRSRFYRDLKDGLDEVENTLKLWRNTGSNTADFPNELELDSIAGSIMQYYIERDLNPLPRPRGRSREQRRPDNRQAQDNTPVRVRAAYNNNRNNNNYRNGDRSNSRSNSRGPNNRMYNRSNRSNPPSRSVSRERDMRQCEFCNGLHLLNTQGCPKLIDFVHLQQYINNTNPDEIQRVVDNMQRERSRSRSQSQSSRHSGQQRDRSSSYDRSRSSNRR